MRPATTKGVRKLGSSAMSGAASSGPTVMPVLSATREMLNASARRSRGERSAIIALLAVMYCAQPKAASKAMRATTSQSWRVRPRPDVERHAAADGDDEDGAAPEPVAQGAADDLHRQVASSAMPRMRPTVVIETPRRWFR